MCNIPINGLVILLTYTSNVIAFLICCLQLASASELEYKPREKMDWVRTWLVNFKTGKTQCVLFECSNNSGAINEKLMKNLYLTLMKSCLSREGYYLSPLNRITAKTLSKKSGALIRFIEFSWDLASSSCFKMYHWFAYRNRYIGIYAIWYHLYNLTNMKNTHQECVTLSKVEHHKVM